MSQVVQMLVQVLAQDVRIIQIMFGPENAVEKSCLLCRQYVRYRFRVNLWSFSNLKRASHVSERCSKEKQKQKKKEKNGDNKGFTARG